jgi:hypothetical protein
MNLIYRLCILIFISHGLCSANSDWQPDFLIIGAQKAGTTALRKFLNEHPNVVKKTGEEHFFDLHFSNGVDWYQKLFPLRNDTQYIIGDKTPYYIFHPLVPQRVYSLYPDVKIIMILRNPIDRAYSQYWMNIRSQQEDLSFEEAINAEESRLAGEEELFFKDEYYLSHKHRYFSYLARGAYVTQIKRWLDFFPREQMLILKNEDLKKHPDEVMKSIFAFLGLSDYHPSLPREDKHSNYKPMSAETRARLVEYFRPYNRQLEELLDIKFDWDE